MEQPKVSIIMASYNHAEYIGQAIESILGQTYTNWEFIIYDDCSTDNSAEIIKAYRDNRIRFYQGKKNIGAVCAFNELLKLTQGEYVAILGSDDMWEKDKLQEQIEVLEKDKDIAVCFSFASLIDEEGMPYPESSCEFDVTIFNQKNRTRGEYVRNFFEKGNYLCHPSSVVRKNVVNEIGMFDKRFRQLHDFYYWTQIVQKYTFFIIQKPLVQYRRKRIDNDSISAGSVINNIRDINESEIIILEMIKNLDKETFQASFSDLMIKKELTELDLICEKYFVLLEWKKIGINNRSLAIRYLNDYLCCEEVWECLKNEYHYTVNDFYAEMANMYQVYPTEYYLEYADAFKEYRKLKQKNEISEQRIQALNNEIETIYNTMSWKITKPLRAIRKMGRKHEH